MLGGALVEIPGISPGETLGEITEKNRGKFSRRNLEEKFRDNI